MIKPNVHSKVPCYDEEKSSCLIDTNDLNMARQIQAAMIPKTLPAADGIDIASLYLPCVSVGGDLFDVVRISEDVFGFVIFDVAGHGISSVLIAAMAKVCFANHIRAVQSPRAIIERVNNEIVRELSADFYITAFVGILDLHDNRLLYSNAGHAYPLVYRKKEHELVPLRTQGTFIGIFQDGFYEEQNIFLNPGDWLILFTDGIFRAFSGVDAFKGRKRLESAILDEIAGLTPEKFLKTIRNKCIMATLNEQDDDVTAVAVEILTHSRRNQIKKKLGFSYTTPVYLQFIHYLEEMDCAISVVLSKMDNFGYPDDCIRKMKIVLTELLVNAIHHGNKKDPTKKVTIGHIVNKRKTVVSIMDEGNGFDPAGVPDPTLPENLIRDCGRGIYIVRHYSDKVTYNENGSRVTITKFYGASA